MPRPGPSGVYRAVSSPCSPLESSAPDDTGQSPVSRKQGRSDQPILLLDWQVRSGPMERHGANQRDLGGTIAANKGRGQRANSSVTRKRQARLACHWGAALSGAGGGLDRSETERWRCAGSPFGATLMQHAKRNHSGGTETFAAPERLSRTTGDQECASSWPNPRLYHRRWSGRNLHPLHHFLRHVC